MAPTLKPPPRREDDAHPDAWQRFEKAVEIGLQTKPMHRETTKGKSGKTIRKTRTKTKKA